MLSSNTIAAVTLVFIVGMVWLRTRMHYPRGRERLLLTRAGRIYFAVLLGVLVLGWLVAPAAGHALWPAAASTPTIAHVVWFLATCIERCGRGELKYSKPPSRTYKKTPERSAPGYLWQQRHTFVCNMTVLAKSADGTAEPKEQARGIG